MPAYPMPLVVPRTRTYTRLGEKFGRQTFALDLRKQSLADIAAMVEGITRTVIDEQVRMGNAPTLIEVDNKTNKPLAEAERKAVTVFGVRLAASAMRAAETELREAITQSTRAHSGALSNVTANWEWRYIPKGKPARVIRTAEQLTTFARGDKLVLVPVRVPYATIVNRNVARSGALNAHNATRGKRGKISKASQNLGFLATAARRLRRRAEFKQFAVIAEFTKAHAVPGEVMTNTQGTGVITIRARYRLVKV